MEEDVTWNVINVRFFPSSLNQNLLFHFSFFPKSIFILLRLMRSVSPELLLKENKVTKKSTEIDYFN